MERLNGLNQYQYFVFRNYMDTNISAKGFKDLWKSDREVILEQLRFMPNAVVAPKHEKDLHYSFGKGLADTQVEENPRVLEWKRVPWDHVFAVQSSVFTDIVNFYKQHLLDNDLVLPPTAFKTDDGWVVKDGTHRLQAIRETLNIRSEIPLATQQHLIIAIGQPVFNAKIYPIDQITKL